MITRISIGVALVALLAVGGARIAQPSTITAASDELYGLTSNNELVAFAKAAPGDTSALITITGLQPGEMLLGIDVRPATNELYALGDSSRLYRIDTATGMATAVGPVLTPMLDGDEFGFDFNNAVDRIRIVSDTGQNLRAHPDTGKVVAVDGGLAYVAADENAGATPMIVAAAYTNPDNDPETGTALFNVDAAANRLVLQDPPNDGGLETIGSLGLPAGSTVHSFDIGSEPPDALVLATPGTDGEPALYRVNLETGATTFIGEVGNASVVAERHPRRSGPGSANARADGSHGNPNHGPADGNANDRPAGGHAHHARAHAAEHRHRRQRARLHDNGMAGHSARRH